MFERAESQSDGRTRRIPRIIHQVFIGGKLSHELKASVDALKTRNPEWEHRLYDDKRAEALVLHLYGEDILRIYHRISPDYLAARVDLLCNLIIYGVGGVYLDIKSTFERPLDEVIRDDDSYILAQWRNGPGERNEGWGLHRDLAHIPGGEYMKHFIIAEPHHGYSAAVIRKIIDNVKNYRPWSAVGRTGTLRTTGPIAYTLGIHPIRDQHPHRIATEEELTAVYSIGGGYNHYAVFKQHYTRQISPVVTLSKAGTLFSRLLVALRAIVSVRSSRRANSPYGAVGRILLTIYPHKSRDDRKASNRRHHRRGSGDWPAVAHGEASWQTSCRTRAGARA